MRAEANKHTAKGNDGNTALQNTDHWNKDDTAREVDAVRCVGVAVESVWNSRAACCKNWRMKTALYKMRALRLTQLARINPIEPNGSSNTDAPMYTTENSSKRTLYTDKAAAGMAAKTNASVMPFTAMSKT